MEPAIEGVIVVRWRQVGLVVNQVWVHPVSTRRLDTDEHIPEAQSGERNLPVMDVAFARRLTPTTAHLVLIALGQAGEPAVVLCGRYARHGVAELSFGE